MCGIYYLKSKNKKHLESIEKNIDHIVEKIKYRGPDTTNVEIAGDMLMVHTLLAIQGFSKQPYKTKNGFLMFNGEIYGTSKPGNQDSYTDTQDQYESDGYFLMDFLEKDNGLEKLADLDGEFVINYFDLMKNKLYVITDPFFTKPFYIIKTSEFIIGSSYKSCITKTLNIFQQNHLENNIVFLKPNTRYTFDLKQHNLLEEKEVIEWNFQPKYSDFKRWNRSFDASIIKRTNTSKNIFVPLSSGYDSGMIVSSLIKNNRKFSSYTFKGLENTKILDEREELINNQNHCRHITVNPKNNFEKKYQEYCNKIEPFEFYHNNGDVYSNIYDAYSCFGLYQIFEFAKKNNEKIYLSGHGGDEIFSDYGNPSNQSASTIYGNFENIRKKWPNFDSSYGRNILQAFERVSGSFGIEARYPFLDKHVVQEFLWLEDYLKNQEFKQCLAQYMRREKFPFLENEKCSVRIITEEEGGHDYFNDTATSIQKNLGIAKNYTSNHNPSDNSALWSKFGVVYFPDNHNLLK